MLGKSSGETILRNNTYCLRRSTVKRVVITSSLIAEVEPKEAGHEYTEVSHAFVSPMSPAYMHDSYRTIGTTIA